MGAISNLNFEAGIIGLAAGQAMAWGFRSGERGTHTSRTMMLDELSHLLETVPGDVSREQYAEAVMDYNCLGKRTAATRKLSLQRLTELYALEPQVILFRVLRDLWGRNETSRPLLALLLALARDPLLRTTATAVIRTPYGHEFARQSMKDALTAAVGDRLNEATLDKVVRNSSSSWTQSGHFHGRGRKTRQKVEATPAATAFALLLGFAVGRRGRLLFETPWAAVLDANPDELIDMAVDAKRLGLLDLKQSGSMIDVSFPILLTDKERELIHGAHRQAG
ncbi:hypothetical protein [Sedimenticola selenatireducens]|uniref:hypothetical protein n=1 Tax=Sedimenticola selenatireducens TaxID=191960 RepID=UPI0004B676A3|nr:hypothetical protein [Sedimenticola selenatireducens]